QHIGKAVPVRLGQVIAMSIKAHVGKFGQDRIKRYIFSNVAAGLLLTLCSQTLITLQPSLPSLRKFLLSRSLLVSIFSRQNFDLILPFQAGYLYPCQKSLSMKIAFLACGNATSGVPGRRL